MFTKIIRGNAGLGPWKDIDREIAPMKSNYLFAIGDGTRVIFWEDTWCGENPLSVYWIRVSFCQWVKWRI